MKRDSTDIVIVGIARTPMGSLGGCLADFSASELGATAIRAAIDDANLSPKDVDEVLMGNVLGAGVGQAPARQAALKADCPDSVNCSTINKVCGSGMKGLLIARQSLLAGDAQVVVAGGMESMSNAPYILDKARSGYRLGHSQLIDHMFLDGLTDAYSKELMGHFAESCVDHYQFTREQQDQYALESLSRVQHAISHGWFSAEITPLQVNGRKRRYQIAEDEPPRLANPEKTPLLKPAFKQDGTVTAANSSSIADGAAALVLMTADEARRRGVNIRARLVEVVEHAQAPEWFTTAPIKAIRHLISKTRWSLDSTDYFEINEAFACVAMAAQRELAIPSNKLNMRGGACALGHPLGATGARIVVSLLSTLEQTNTHKGIAALCIGGGEAMALALERP